MGQAAAAAAAALKIMQRLPGNCQLLDERCMLCLCLIPLVAMWKANVLSGQIAVHSARWSAKHKGCVYAKLLVLQLASHKV
jgi:hypothetical protein